MQTNDYFLVLPFGVVLFSIVLYLAKEHMPRFFKRLFTNRVQEHPDELHSGILNTISSVRDELREMRRDHNHRLTSIEVDIDALNEKVSAESASSVQIEQLENEFNEYRRQVDQDVKKLDSIVNKLVSL